MKEDFIFMNIQVTSPLRKVEYIYTVFDMFKDCDHLVSITKPKLSKSLFMENKKDTQFLPVMVGIIEDKISLTTYILMILYGC